MTVDWEVLRQDVADLLEGFASEFVEVELRDLGEWARIVADDLVICLQQGEEDLVDELKDQALLVLEMKRIRLARQGKELLGRIIDAGYRFALRAIAAAV